MIELVKIELSELPPFVECAYEGDNDLLTKYHIANYTLCEAVDTTMVMIEITSLGLDMKYFAVIENEEPIGYLSTFPNNLYSFGINIEYRTREILSEFWKKITEILGNSFISMLYHNNTRAINWLKRCEMVEVDGVEDSCVTLLYHNLN